ncbi:21876_t:CDS:1, partial [Gigaspora margarita]
HQPLAKNTEMDNTNDTNKIPATGKRKPTPATQEKTPTTSEINLKLLTPKMQKKYQL